MAHSPAITLNPKNASSFSLTWFQGGTEGGEDVAIWATKLSFSNQHWQHSSAHPFFYPSELSQILNPPQAITTLGNTVQFGHSANQYLTTIVSVGGWAMASVALLTLSKTEPRNIEQAKVLSLSPILNRSYLVRSPTIKWQNGDIGLPAYFEMGTFYGALIRISPDGKVKDQRTISRGAMGIQPTVVVLDKNHAVAFLRNFSDDVKIQGQLLGSWSNDGGQTWSKLERLTLPNPDSPVAALLLSNGNILLGFNDHKNCADTFRLAISSDMGRTWTRISTLEQHNCKRSKNVRYPMLKRLNNGEIALTYSFNNKGGIRAYVFNESWLNQQLARAKDSKP